MNKIIKVGTVENRPLYCKIVYNDGRLSITGVIGPKKNYGSHGGAGQVIMSFLEYDRRGHLTLSNITPSQGWDYATIKRFFDVWDRWHLNDMQAGSPRQMDYLRLHPQTSYDAAVAILKGVNLYCDEGYTYGSAWLTEAVPADVIAFLEGLPESTTTPAWV